MLCPGGRKLTTTASTSLTSGSYDLCSLQSVATGPIFSPTRSSSTCKPSAGQPSGTEKMHESGGDSVKRLGQFRTGRPTNRQNSRDSHRLDRVNSLGENGGGGGTLEPRGNAGIYMGANGPVETVPMDPYRFSCTEAAQMMSERWTATISALNNPSVDVLERPVVHEGGSVWGSSKLPFQVSVSDFLEEMGQAMAVLRSNTTNTTRDQNVREYSLF